MFAICFKNIPCLHVLGASSSKWDLNLTVEIPYKLVIWLVVSLFQFICCHYFFFFLVIDETNMQMQESDDDDK